jgi:hypothetical protein
MARSSLALDRSRCRSRRSQAEERRDATASQASSARLYYSRPGTDCWRKSHTPLSRCQIDCEMGVAVRDDVARSTTGLDLPWARLFEAPARVLCDETHALSWTGWSCSRRGTRALAPNRQLDPRRATHRFELGLAVSDFRRLCFMKLPAPITRVDSRHLRSSIV